MQFRLHSDQRTLFVKPSCRARKCERHDQSRHGEHRAFDRTQATPLAFRFGRAAPNAKATADFQHDQHAVEEQYREKPR